MDKKRNAKLGLKVPFYMLLFYLTMTWLMFLNISELSDPSSIICFPYWIIWLLVIFFYSRASLKNPGYIIPDTTWTNDFKIKSNEPTDQSSKDSSRLKKDSEPKSIDSPKSSRLQDEKSSMLHDHCISTVQPNSEPIRAPQIQSFTEILPNNEDSHTTYSGNGSFENQEIVEEQENEIICQESAIIETRYCLICKIDQPIRAKHCKECGKCVALHDHHCPWLGVCVGEKNRREFYWYLVFQCTELWISDVINVMSFQSEDEVFGWILENCTRMISVIFLAFFTVMVSCLLGFHTYLALHNVTTWEIMSWHKISYLKQFPSEMGSPFSKGYLKNLYIYCCEKFPKGHKIWTVNQGSVVNQVRV